MTPEWPFKPGELVHVRDQENAEGHGLLGVTLTVTGVSIGLNGRVWVCASENPHPAPSGSFLAYELAPGAAP
jgi:hypothetical protein